MAESEFQRAATEAHQYLLEGHTAQAETLYRKILLTNPDYAPGWHMMGILAGRSGQQEVAVRLLERASLLDPQDFRICSDLGNAFLAAGRFSEAIQTYRQSLGFKPDSPEILANLGCVLQIVERLDEGVDVCREALRQQPNSANALNNLGNCYKDLGRIDEAIKCYRQAMATEPWAADLHSNLIFALGLHPGADPRMILEECREWNRLHGSARRESNFPNDPSPNRRLRIGYVSSDFRNHVVGQNLLPLLRHHDCERFEIVGYGSVANADALTERLRLCFSQWRNIQGLSDEQAVQLVRADRIDILVDLSLHSAGNRLPLFARKPAPVQISYLGYCGTTGLDAIDCRLSDPFLDPPDADLTVYSEKTVRLPSSYWCYEPLGPVPDVGALPAGRTGNITFGCLNHFAKVSRLALELWVDILCKVPQSRLLLNVPAGTARAEVISVFTARRIPPERIEFVAKQDWDDYIRTWQRIDIGLDPCPCTGGITTCDALWMGVPVVTLAGDSSRARGGKSILSSILLPELIADSPEQYVKIATGLAGDLARMHELRSSLRNRMESSPLRDAAKFAHDFESTLIGIWKNWRSPRTNAETAKSECGGRSEAERAMEHYNTGNAFQARGETRLAIGSFRDALKIHPEYPEALCNLGAALQLIACPDEAIQCYQKALTIDPGQIEARNNLANALLRQGRPEEAIEEYQAALRVNPQYASAHFNLGNAFQKLNDLDAAAESYKRAIRCNPDDVDACNNLGNCYKEVGQPDEAIRWYQRALALQPRAVRSHSNWVCANYFLPGCDPHEICAEARRWQEKHAANLKQSLPPLEADRSVKRVLRVGFISPDFRRHVVGSNLLPLLREHDRTQFEFFGYSDVETPDEFTAEIREQMDQWREIRGMSDEQVTRSIRSDRIDILFDLALHAPENRLLVFARRAAPVQVTYLGYCGTTGLDEMDYRLSDPVLDPPGSDLTVYSEKTVRLPHTYWCYQPLGPTPQVTNPPCASGRSFTFGCLNRPVKASAVVLNLWTEILKQVPESGLLLCAPWQSYREAVLACCRRAGISENRIEFVGAQPWEQHIRTYERIDVCLDPFPYGGGITSCDALWMGVPVVTLCGQTAVGRGTSSILSDLGLPEWIATSPEQYVQIAGSFAKNRHGLKDLRAGLRSRMTRSPLRDAVGFARDIEAICREMWKGGAKIGNG